MGGRFVFSPGLPWQVWFCLLACFRLLAAEERFTIRSEVTVTASDSYRQETHFSDGFLSNETTRNDSLSYRGTCEEKRRLVDRTWETTSEFSSYSISGGGHYEHIFHPRQGSDDVQNNDWSYSTDPSAYDPQKSDMTVNLSSKFVTCAVTPSIEFPQVISGLGNGMASPLAMMIMLNYSPTVAIDPVQLPTNTTSYTVTKVYSTNFTIPFTGTGESGQRSATYQCTVTVQRNPAELEAVILTNLPPDVPPFVSQFAYPDWLPQGGTNEDDPGSSLLLRIIIRQKGSSDEVPVSYAKAKFIFQLSDVTREPGVCLNSPSKDSAATSPDLLFHASDNLDALDGGLGAASVKDDLNAINVAIDSFDYGAFGKLSVIARVQGVGDIKAFVQGRPDQFVLPVPADENQNRIADKWEKDEGVFGGDTDPAADNADEPVGQAGKGDGIGLYERYRGFRTVKGYGRLKARPKYVFVRDADGLLEWSMKDPEVKNRSFPKVSGCKVLLIDSDQWTGPGWRDEDRIINFNTSGHGHAVDQHALHLVANNDSQPIHPSGWLTMYNDGLDPTNQLASDVPPMNLGSTYPLPGLAPDALDSPRTAYKCVVFIGLFPNYELDMVRYHTAGLPEYVRYTDKSYFTNLPPAGQAAAKAFIDGDAEQYIKDHPTEHNRWFRLMLGLVVTHELCHGLGVPHHQPESTDGYWECVMRYFETGRFRSGDFPRTPDDRFELGLRKIWPYELCTSGAGTPRGSCWRAVRVTDKR